ncbi:hypothetical protein HanPSC8_Chr13g0573581 [Helianthus annuus]|nr:hypothetical protein HanPSC8_Chr13g0573581 [Helianthus annuus]
MFCPTPTRRSIFSLLTRPNENAQNNLVTTIPIKVYYSTRNITSKAFKAQ